MVAGWNCFIHGPLIPIQFQEKVSISISCIAYQHMITKQHFSHLNRQQSFRSQMHKSYFVIQSCMQIIYMKIAD